MQKLSIAIAIIFMVFLSYCNQKQNPEVPETIIDEATTPAKVKFSIVKRIALPNINYSSLFVTSNDIYVSCTSVLEIYDKELNYISKKTFPIGQGPGDLGTGARFFRYGNRIYAPDNTQQRINLFDQDFKFIKFVKYMQGLYPLTFIKNGEYFICIQEKGEGFHPKITYVVSLYSFPGLKKKILYQLRPFSLRDHNGKLILFNSDGVDFFYRKEKIYIINMNSYQINMLDISGKILKRIRVDYEKQKVPKEMREPWLKAATTGSFYRRFKNRITIVDYIQPASYMVPLGKGFAVVRRKSYDPQCSGLVEADYFDYHLNRIIGKIQIPCFYKIFNLLVTGYFPYTYKYQDGYLYLLSIDEEEKYYMEKWRVEE